MTYEIIGGKECYKPEGKNYQPEERAKVEIWAIKKTALDKQEQLKRKQEKERVRQERVIELTNNILEAEQKINCAKGELLKAREACRLLKKELYAITKR